MNQLLNCSIVETSTSNIQGCCWEANVWSPINRKIGKLKCERYFGVPSVWVYRFKRQGWNDSKWETVSHHFLRANKNQRNVYIHTCVSKNSTSCIFFFGEIVSFWHFAWNIVTSKVKWRCWYKWYDNTILFSYYIQYNLK